MMVKGGFPRDYATALVAVASVIGIIIPPSIPMVIYGMVASSRSPGSSWAAWSRGSSSGCP